MTDPAPAVGFTRLTEGDRRPEAMELLRNLKASLPDLEKALEEANGHWVGEDGIYRFYHQSFKVYRLQETTLAIVEALKKLTPALDPEARKRPKFWYYFAKETERPATPPPLHPWFLKIVEEGTGKEFDVSHNDHWQKLTRPIVEAFFHARYFLEMAVKYGREFKDVEYAPNFMPSGWAAFLYLYDLR